MLTRNYYVYIVASQTRTIYIGLTNNLVRRIFQHKEKVVEGFTRKYNCTRLVYFEHFNDVRAAIAREKQIKDWIRKKKVALVESMNPQWEDLTDSVVGKKSWPVKQQQKPNHVSS